MGKRFSVIITVYNAEKYIKKCLDSIINQTSQDFEVIIVDDGSKDGSCDIIEDYIKSHNNVIKFFQREHSGIANVRNFAIKEVNSEYFLFVDSDDYIELNLLENLLAYTNKYPDTDIIKYKMKIIESNSIKNISGPIFASKNGQDAFNELCFEDTMIDTPCLYLFRTQFYKKNNFKFLPNTYHEDFGILPLIIAKSNKFISTNIYGYNYVQIQNSITRNYDYNTTKKKANDLLLHYDNLLNYITNCNFGEETIKNLKQYYTNAILLATKNLNKEDANKYIDEIERRKLRQNIQGKNMRQVVKKIILNLNLRLYLKLK